MCCPQTALWRTLTLALVVVSGTAGITDCLPAAELKSGDMVVTVEEDVELGYRDKTEVKLPRGHRLSVTEVRDPWIGGYAEVGGEKRFGWVHKRQVKLQIKPVAEFKDADDDAAARQALTAIGVELDIDADDQVIGVNASNTPIPDAGLACLRHFPRLASLQLSATSIGDPGLVHLGSLKSLEQLYLDQTEITDVGVKQLAGLENLDLIALEATRATGASLAVLKKMPVLRTINLSRCKVNDRQLESCAGMDELEVLNLSHTQVTGDTFDTLQPLAKLRVLNVNGAPLDDDGLLKLSEQPTLKMLYIRETQITDETIRQLRDTLNSCAIYRY